MPANRESDYSGREALIQVTLLGLLILVAVSMALLAVTTPSMNLELPLGPEFTLSPPSPHMHP